MKIYRAQTPQYLELSKNSAKWAHPTIVNSDKYVHIPSASVMCAVGLAQNHPWHICKTLIPSILTGTTDIAPWLLFKTSLIFVRCFRNIPTIFCCFVLSFWFVQKGVVTIIFTDHYSSIFTFESFLQFGLCEFWTWTSCILVSLTFQRTFLGLFFMTKFLRVKMFSSRVIFFMSWRNPLPSILTSTLDILS